FEVVGGAGRHGSSSPFTIADEGKRLACGAGLRRAGRRWGDSCRAVGTNPRSPTIVVFTSAIPTHHTDGLAATVCGHHGVHAIGLAGATEVFDGLAGAVGSGI